MQRPFRQVDVFSSAPYRGNPVAVVLDADGLTTEETQLFARWTNLCETTFLLRPDPPDQPGADYRVRIFTASAELPFAGHPTLGTGHAWLEAGGVPADKNQIVQQCKAGPIRLRRQDGLLGFAAPPLVRAGPVEESLVREITSLLGIARSDIVDLAWADNGPGWVALHRQPGHRDRPHRPDPRVRRRGRRHLGQRRDGHPHHRHRRAVAI